MNRRFRVLAACTVIIAGALHAPAEFSFSSQADVYLTKLMKAQEFSGAVLVATNGSVVFAKAYGLANREHGIANTTNTIFRLGSVTKQFTAMCVLILLEQHKLSVSNVISQYVEDCPAAWKTNHNPSIVEPVFTRYGAPCTELLSPSMDNRSRNCFYDNMKPPGHSHLPNAGCPGPKP